MTAVKDGINTTVSEKEQLCRTCDEKGQARSEDA